jgi:hypothetical protein
VFRERLGLDFLSDVTSFDEGLEALLDLLIEIHREQRFILAAIDSEVLGNLAVYDELVKEVDVGNLMSEDARPVLDVLKQLFKHYPTEGLELKDGVLACKVMDILIHRYIYLEHAFNTEQKFKEIIIKIIHSLF